MNRELKDYIWHSNGWYSIPVNKEPAIIKTYKLLDLYGNTIVQGNYSLCVHVRNIKFGKNSKLKIKLAK